MSDETRLTGKIVIASDAREGCDGEYGLTGWTSRGPSGTRRETIDVGTLADVRALGEALVAFAAKPAREPSPASGPGCDLCGDNAQPMSIRARCHMTAPLRAEIADGHITLYCYVPSCNRKVATFALRGQS